MSSPRSQKLMTRIRSTNSDLRARTAYKSHAPAGRAGVSALCKAGVCTISYDFYESGRHEMLNELSRGQARTNILVWLSYVLHDQSRNRRLYGRDSTCTVDYRDGVGSVTHDCTRASTGAHRQAEVAQLSHAHSCAPPRCRVDHHPHPKLECLGGRANRPGNR